MRVVMHLAPNTRDVCRVTRRRVTQVHVKTGPATNDRHDAASPLCVQVQGSSSFYDNAHRYVKTSTGPACLFGTLP